MTPLMQSKVARAPGQAVRARGRQRHHRKRRWIVAATNRDLETMVANGQFRSTTIVSTDFHPSAAARERVADIPLLVEHYAFRGRVEQTGLDACETMDLLTRYLPKRENCKASQASDHPPPERSCRRNSSSSPYETANKTSMPLAARTDLTTPLTSSSPRAFVQARSRRRTDFSVEPHPEMMRVPLHGRESFAAAHLLGLRAAPYATKSAYGIRVSQSVVVEGQPDETEEDLCTAPR